MTAHLNSPLDNTTKKTWTCITPAWAEGEVGPGSVVLAKEGHEGMRFGRNITARVSGTGENNL